MVRQTKSKTLVQKPLKHPSNQNSGVKQLGNVPNHWEVRRLKSCLGINERALQSDTDPDYFFDYLDIGSVELGRLLKDPVRTRFEDSPTRARRIVRRGDVIVSTVRTYLKAVWHAKDVDANVIASTGFAVLTPKADTNPEYVSYYCQSSSFTDLVSSESVGVAYPAIAETRLAVIKICIPPLCEQKAISRYLDHEINRIANCIQIKYRLINLLEEYKASTIQEVVTGRIDIRTNQPYTSYRESEIDWLERVPEHWKVRRLKSTIDECTNGTWGSDPNGDSDQFCIRVHDFDRTTWRVCLNRPTIRSVDAKERNRATLKINDLLVEKSGGGEKSPVGAVVLWNHIVPAICSNFIMRMSVERHSDANYLAYIHSVLYANRINVRFIKQTTGIQNLDVGAYLTEKIAIPPLSEQIAITQYLDEFTSKINNTVQGVRKQVDLLYQYRTRLITDVVTGKLDVHELTK